MNTLAHKKQQHGMTLVELMVAITISLTMLAGVVQIFIGNKQTYRVTEELSRVQENGRFTMDFLAREVRMADFWGCANAAVDVTNHLNPPNPPNTPAAHPVDPWANNTIAGANNTGLNGSDTLTLQGAYGEGIGIVSHALATATFDLTTVNHGLDDGDVVIATDCEKADVIEVTTSNPGTDVTVIAGLGSNNPGFGNNTFPGAEYNNSGTLYRVKSVTYSILPGASGEPALFRNENGNNVELVEGVQNMQVLFGEDTDGDLTANRYLPAGAAGLVMNNVVSIRITLTLITLRDLIRSDNTFGRISRTYTTTASIRNRLIDN